MAVISGMDWLQLKQLLGSKPLHSAQIGLQETQPTLPKKVPLSQNLVQVELSAL